MGFGVLLRCLRLGLFFTIIFFFRRFSKKPEKSPFDSAILDKHVFSRTTVQDRSEYDINITKPHKLFAMEIKHCKYYL